MSMAACGSKNDSTAKEDGGASGDAEYKVLYVSRNQADTFAARLSSDFQKYWESTYKDKFSFDIQDAQADSDKENQIIEQAITAGYDAIIVQPNDSDSQTPYVKQGVEAGVKMLTTNAGIRVLKAAFLDCADPYDG